MKAHHWAGLLFVVVLVAVGYVLTVWMSSTLPRASEEDHAQTPSQSSGNAHSAGNQGAAPSTSSTPATTSSNSSAVSLPKGSLVLTVERAQGQSGESVVTFKLQASSQDVDLSGLRLADALGMAGHEDHSYYFGSHLVLAAGQTLTLHNTCGRDQGLTLYWCMRHDVSILDTQAKELYLYDGLGQLVYTCTPPAAEGPTLRYQCG